METHKLHEELLRKTVEVLVVGCGGNGSTIVGGLPFLQQSMRWVRRRRVAASMKATAA
jgi:hypothetical protein